MVDKSSLPQEPSERQVQADSAYIVVKANLPRKMPWPNALHMKKQGRGASYDIRTCHDREVVAVVQELRDEDRWNARQARLVAVVNFAKLHPTKKLIGSFCG